MQLCPPGSCSVGMLFVTYVHIFLSGMRSRLYPVLNPYVGVGPLPRFYVLLPDLRIFMYTTAPFQLLILYGTFYHLEITLHCSSFSEFSILFLFVYFSMWTLESINLKINLVKIYTFMRLHLLVQKHGVTFHFFKLLLCCFVVLKFPVQKFCIFLAVLIPRYLFI